MAFPLLLLFNVSYFLHLTSRLPFLGAIRFDFVLMAILTLSMFLQPKEYDQQNQDNTIRRRFIIFFVYIILTIPLVKWPGSVINFGFEFYIKVAMFFFFITAFVKSERQLKILVAIIIGCQVFRGLEPVYLYITTGYLPEQAYSGSGGQGLARLAGAPHDVISANPYAFVIVTTFPFIYFFCFLGRKSYIKIISLFTVSFLGYGLVLSGSRTGLVTLLVAVLACIFFSQKIGVRTVVSLTILFCVAYVVAGQLSPELAERYLSLVDSSVAGGATAEGRFTGMQNQLTTIININGLLGHGLGTSKEVNANSLGFAQLSHDIYIELLQEVGIVGFILFILYMKSIFQSLNNASKTVVAGSFLARLTISLKAWFVMCVVYGFACFGVSSWEWYVFGGVSAACVTIINKQLAASETPVPQY